MKQGMARRYSGMGWMLLLAAGCCAPLTGAAQDAAQDAVQDARRDKVIEAVTIHPPMAARFQCSEHAAGSEDHVPDALGADCVVVKRTGGPNGNLLSLHTGDGSRNEDWHGWREVLLAPCDGVVTIVSLNPETATPGAFGPGRSGALLFKCGKADDAQAVQVAYVHVQEPTVKEGDAVRAGAPVARIGNNGSSFHPHVHVGAFRGDLFSPDAVPLQVRFDLEAMGRL